MQCFLLDKHGDRADAAGSVLYASSTQNKIERWWRELLDRMERFFKRQLSTLVVDGDYDPTNGQDRNMLAYVYIPVLQKELDVFRVSVWNYHRVRKQRGKELPTGVPEHIYQCLDQYGGEKCCFPITEQQLMEVANLSNVLDDTDNYLEPNFHMEWERHIPDTNEIEPAEAANAYLYLKANSDPNRV
ncbi:hypothetical protein ACROYT_G014568 [Oculina patagonica]